MSNLREGSNDRSQLSVNQHCKDRDVIGVTETAPLQEVAQLHTHNITVYHCAKMCVQIRIGTRGFNFNTGDRVEHFSAKHTTRGILQGFPGARRWNGAGGCQARLFVSRADCAEKSRSVHWMMSRKVNLAKLGSRRQNRSLGGPVDNRRLHRVRRVVGGKI